MISILIFGLACGPAMAHELTPTYPEFRRSFMDGISVTTMELYNAREEVDIYKISVHTENWERIPFASASNVIKVLHNERYTFDVYVRNADLDRIEFICTVSSNPENQEDTEIASRVCSRVK
jgi:hypothetical protein